MGQINTQQQYMLDLIKEFIASIEGGSVELIDLGINITKEGIISMVIAAKDNNE